MDTLLLKLKRHDNSTSSTDRVGEERCQLAPMRWTQQILGISLATGSGATNFFIQLVKKGLQYFTEARLQVEAACSHRTVDRFFNR
jgi:hypothetical protein